MNLKGMPIRAIIALISCVLLVYLFGLAVEAFVPGAFSAAQTKFVDVLIFVAGFIYMLFGTWPVIV